MYAPNSFGGPAADTSGFGDIAGWHAAGEMVREAYSLHAEDDDWSQARALLMGIMDDAARERFVGNVAGHLSGGVSKPMLKRALEYWANVDAGVAQRIKQAVSG